MSHHDVRLVSVTGDTSTGKIIQAAAAETVKRVHLELGGKAPVVVFDDADIGQGRRDAQVRRLHEHRPGLHGVVPRRRRIGIYEDLLAELVPAVESHQGRRHHDETVEMGPLVSEAQRESVAGFVERAQGRGAKVLTGGEPIDGPGFYYKPTVVADVDQKAEIVQKEVFGPVVTVQRFSDEDQAVAWANDVVYGLASSVWTKDAAGRARVAGGCSSAPCG